MHHLRSRNKPDLFFQFREHFTENLISHCMGMADANRLTVMVGNPDQSVQLFSDEIRILNMIQKHISLSKRYLQ